MRKRLLAIYDDIDRRTHATGDAHAWWPCRRGCDSCCRRLADVPQLVRAEWELLAEGIAALPEGVRAGVDARIAVLREQEAAGRLPRHIICPLLDEAEGACRVYAHRPGACRTYGFYVERELGLHCDQITAAVAEHEDAVVWGNQVGVDDALGKLAGRPRSLTAWSAGRKT